MSKTIWNKAPKLKKLSKSRMREYILWMSDNEPYCQVCGVVGDDLHHLFYGCRGADKDDRYLLTTCRQCHEWCHSNKQESQEKFKETAYQNWENFNA